MFCLHGGVRIGGRLFGLMRATVKENDLRITINADVKVSEQCCIAASKGNQIVGLIRRNIKYKEKS